MVDKAVWGGNVDLSPTAVIFRLFFSKLPEKQIHESAKNAKPHFTQCIIGIRPLATHGYRGPKSLKRA